VADRTRATYRALNPGKPNAGRGDEAMSKYERRMFFERLVELRDAYGTRGDDDTFGTHDLTDVMRDAELALDAIEAALHLDEAPLHLDEAPMGMAGGEEPSR
jgi:hypothetical protein